MRGGTCWVPLIKMKAVKARTSVSASRGLQGLTKRMRVMRRVVSSGCQPVGVNGRVCGVYCHILLVQARRFKNHVSEAEPISCCKLALL